METQSASEASIPCDLALNWSRAGIPDRNDEAAWQILQAGGGIHALSLPWWELWGMPTSNQKGWRYPTITSTDPWTTKQIHSYHIPSFLWLPFQICFISLTWDRKCPHEGEIGLKVMASNTGLWKGKVVSHDGLLRKHVSCHTNSPQASIPLSASSSLTSVGKAGVTETVVWVNSKHSVKVTVLSPSAPAPHSEEGRAKGNGLMQCYLGQK